MGTNNNSMRIIKDVYWPEKMKLYFEQTMRATPSQFRNFASGNLVREIEDKTRERNATEVAEQDLVNAFLDTIPVFFRSDMIKLLSDLGINVSRPKDEKILVNDIDKMKEAIIESAELAGVAYNEQLIDKVIGAYETNFSSFRTCISFCTSTKRAEHRGLLVTFVDVFNQFNPYQVALDNHLLPNNDLPVDKFMGEVSAAVPVLGYSIDFGVVTGVERIAVVCASHLPQKMEKIIALKNAPDSIKANMPLLERYQLMYGSIFGVNYLKSLVTIQFMVKQMPRLTVDLIESLLKDFDFKIPQRNVMELCTAAIAVIMEFSYIKNQPDSISFEMCVHSYEEIPKKMSSFIDNYAKNAPFRASKRKYIYIITYTRSGQYLQIKNDYSGTTVDSITGPFNQKQYGEED